MTDKRLEELEKIKTIIRESYLADPLAEQGIMHCYPKEKHEYEREMAIEHLAKQILSSGLIKEEKPDYEGERRDMETVEMLSYGSGSGYGSGYGDGSG